MASTAPGGSTARTQVIEVRAGREPVARLDEVAREEPLELRVADETIAVVMRTPGADDRLALGFLLGEGIIASAADLASVAHCGRPGDEGFSNVVNAVPAPGARI